jgi:hypothetical protein
MDPRDAPPLAVPEEKLQIYVTMKRGNIIKIRVTHVDPFHTICRLRAVNRDNKCAM